ncbi:MAG: 4a-hydroxytetrahydrobiopterin dehydratase [Gemmatimonadetes bacterium]|nr:4a-hydroxytetrahydrobiopterin dehydratase [Gemmatimonadota bacterium]
MALLGDHDIAEGLTRLDGWVREGDAIVRSFRFRDFAQAIDFVRRVAELAEDANHHPDIDIRYTRVILTVSTHSAGGITRKDLDLAARINTLFD